VYVAVSNSLQSATSQKTAILKNQLPDMQLGWGNKKCMKNFSRATDLNAVTCKNCNELGAYS
jgi:hypothetical protein